ncbi:hypothetical protein JTB14_023217 [Gonioctena quinquepunctata]|nr:hypothetical protein JTB14_023217 [Gonioctena quinquepunctata]
MNRRQQTRPLTQKEHETLVENIDLNADVDYESDEESDWSDNGEAQDLMTEVVSETEDELEIESEVKSYEEFTEPQELAEECSGPIYTAKSGLQWKKQPFVTTRRRQRKRAERKEHGKLAAIRNIWDMFVDNCKKSFEPYEQITVDEQLVCFRGKCLFRQYIKYKPGRYGIKIWAAADTYATFRCTLENLEEEYERRIKVFGWVKFGYTRFDPQLARNNNR